MSAALKTNPAAEDDTPMMQQYQRIKRDYPQAILFYRMGDFYEMFNEDARAASPILEIALTSRNKNKSNPVPMCGVPYHSANAYIAKLLKAGKIVAICEQMEDPRFAKGIVKREVIRVITPGTVLDDNLLDPRNHQFLAAISFGQDGFGMAALDLTTGLFRTTEIDGESAESLLKDELDKIEAKEILVPGSALNQDGGKWNWLNEGPHYLRPYEDWAFAHGQAHRRLLEHFKTASLEGFGCEHLKKAVSAAGAVVQYLYDTQKTALDHIVSLSTFNIRNYMALDQATVKSLELVQSSQGSRKNSLLDALDLSLTPMGSRKIKEWILKPLVHIQDIETRLASVEEFKNGLILRTDLREQLRRIFDLERLLGRISLAAGNPRDLAALKNSIAVFPKIREILDRDPSSALSRRLETWDNLESVHDLIDRTIVDDPPPNVKDGNLIRPGCNEELDRLRNVSRNGKGWIAALEEKERARTGISLLKVGYNKIYGYYIEVTKKNADRVPPDYIRKQSLVNAERYASPELKDYEAEITGAEEKIAALEAELFQQTRQSVAAEGARIQKMAGTVSEIDALAAFAEAAHRHNYARPRVDDGLALQIENGRHPLVERLAASGRFIPNDTHLDCGENQIMIITGPNMAGKSTYLRQTALIALMAQIGSFVPADRAVIGLVDRIFSRVGAQDFLLRGQSTFMVEMNETANILNNATRKSLIILDEIGRGTSTFDGISIAWAIVEYLHGAHRIGAKTLFATHYHELTELAAALPGVKNQNVQVKEWNDEIVFLRKIVPGGADKSYGIQVARLAGLPEQVLKRAREVLFNLENSEFDEVGTPRIGHSQEAPEAAVPQQLNLFNETERSLVRRLKEVHPDELSPRQALDLIFELTQLIRERSL
ncbi:MAG: DNA mismatch repair protein MutS [Nitrospinae bacterium]|nr:DNA mismatch repair protein MutS [Nitrospinota bacterium]